MNIPLSRGAKITNTFTFFQLFFNLFFTLFITRWTREDCPFYFLLTMTLRRKVHWKIKTKKPSTALGKTSAIAPMETASFGGGVRR